MNLPTKKDSKSMILGSYLLLSVVEVIAEYFKNSTLIFGIKPLLLPLLAIGYILTTKRISKIFVIALFFNWIASLLLICDGKKYLLIASILFMCYRILILVKVYKDISCSLVSNFVIVIGSLPFLLVSLYTMSMLYETTNSEAFSVIVMQSLVIILLGGMSLGNYFLKNDTSSKYLLFSTLLFSIHLFILGILYYYIKMDILKPIAMSLYFFGQYFLFKYVIQNERIQQQMLNVM